MSSLLARMRLKPKQKDDDNGQVEAAVAKLKDARRFDDSKQYSTAVMLYEEGLRLLIERHSVESDEPKKAPGKRAAKKGAVEPVATKKAKA